MLNVYYTVEEKIFLSVSFFKFQGSLSFKLLLNISVSISQHSYFLATVSPREAKTFNFPGRLSIIYKTVTVET